MDSGSIRMRGLLLLSAAAVLAASTSANAADLRRPAPMPTKAPPVAYVAPPFSWTGFYLGINGGGGWGSSHSDLAGHTSTSGGIAGGTVGYNLQMGSWVFGLEGDIDWSDIGGSTTNNCPSGCTVTNKWLNTDRGRIGYALGSFLPYITGGLAVGDIRATVPGFSGLTSTQVGWTAGAGAEYAISGPWSAKVEYLHVDLGRFNCGLSCGVTPTDNVSFHEDVVRGGINYRF
jgi:outer membrane immunogenic protein